MTRWLTRSLADVPSDDAWLGPDERLALARLRFDRRRADWRLGRHAAKAAAGAFLSVDPARVQVCAAPGGEPLVLVDGRSAGLELSLSHRDGRALVVVAPPGLPVGCDLELVEPRSPAFLREWLTPSERALVSAAPSVERPRLANLCWSAKEAAAKARRQGLRLDVRHAEVRLGSAPASREGWLALSVDWQEGAADRDHGWYRCGERWVMTVVGGEPARSPCRLGEGPTLAFARVAYDRRPEVSGPGEEGRCDGQASGGVL